MRIGFFEAAFWKKFVFFLCWFSPLKSLMFHGLRAQILGTILEPKSLVRENPKPLYNYRIMVFR